MYGLGQLPTLPKRESIERAWQVRLLRSYELGLESHLAHVLAQTGRRAAIRYRAGDEDLVDMLASSLRRVIRPSLIATARAFAERIVQSSPTKRARDLETKAPAELDQAIVDFMNDHTAELVVDVSDTTRDAIANAIEQGMADEATTDEIADMIVEATSGDIGLARARRIARTETHAAAMFGQQAAAEAMPFDFDKTWLAVEDDRVRPAHAEANGQTVALDETFDVGGEALRYPGDIEGSAGNIINCRCVCLYEPKLEE